MINEVFPFVSLHRYSMIVYFNGRYYNINGFMNIIEKRYLFEYLSVLKDHIIMTNERVNQIY